LCADAVVAPIPVSERTSCASKPALSIAARLLLSVTENSHTPMKPTAIENRAGEVYGKISVLLWKTSTHTDFDSTVRPTAVIRPRKPPMVAPRVVHLLHRTDMNSTGKLAEAAMAKASDTMKATLTVSNT
jgi:hypothetical protein